MTQYVAKRILTAIPMLWLGLTLTFFIMHLAPGDPTDKYVSPNFDPAVQQLMTQKFGLDQPLYVQYWRWLSSFVQGDFGISFDRARPVRSVIGPYLGNTLILSSLALLVSLTAGVFLGIVSAMHRGSPGDDLLTVGSIVLYSIPGFWLGLMLMLLFSSLLGWLPAGGIVSVNHEYLGLGQRILDRLVHLILPVFVLAAASTASTMRYMRGSMLEIIQQDYIRTARAKGLPERTVILKHAVRNALSPVITLFGLSIPYIFSGAVIVEIVFSWPGMGRVMLTSIFQRDYPVTIAVTAIIFAMVLLGNLLADVLYGVVDPRVRYGAGHHS